jgi:hypothetical protein
MARGAHNRGKRFGKPFGPGGVHPPSEEVEEPVEDVAAEPDDGLPDQLRDMRHVYEQPASQDRTPGQRNCRAWLKKDLSKFMVEKTALEAKYLEAGRAAGASSETGVSVEPAKPEPMIELVERWLKERGYVAGNSPQNELTRLRGVLAAIGRAYHRGDEGEVQRLLMEEANQE